MSLFKMIKKIGNHDDSHEIDTLFGRVNQIVSFIEKPGKKVKELTDLVNGVIDKVNGVIAIVDELTDKFAKLQEVAAVLFAKPEGSEESENTEESEETAKA